MGGENKRLQNELIIHERVRNGRTGEGGCCPPLEVQRGGGDRGAVMTGKTIGMDRTEGKRTGKLSALTGNSGRSEKTAGIRAGWRCCAPFRQLLTVYPGGRAPGARRSGRVQVVKA